MTKEQAFQEVHRKVGELQEAVMRLHSLHQDGYVGLLEWCDHMNETVMEIGEEIFTEYEEE